MENVLRYITLDEDEALIARYILKNIFNANFLLKNESSYLFYSSYY